MILTAKDKGGTSALGSHVFGSGRRERSLREVPFYGVAAIH